MRLIGLAVVLTLSLVLAPLAAAEGQRQQAAKVPRIGVLTPTFAGGYGPFHQGLRELGYVEGKNLAIEYRFAEGKLDRLPALAAELVRLKVDIVVAIGGPSVHVAMKATETIPIVMMNAGDPVDQGFVASLARPGGNVTALSSLTTHLAGKRLELLKEMIPFPRGCVVASGGARQARSGRFDPQLERKPTRRTRTGIAASIPGSARPGGS